MKPFYKAIVELYEQFEEELAKEGRSYAAQYAVESKRAQPSISPLWFLLTEYFLFLSVFLLIIDCSCEFVEFILVIVFDVACIA